VLETERFVATDGGDSEVRCGTGFRRRPTVCSAIISHALGVVVAPFLATISDPQAIRGIGSQFLSVVLAAPLSVSRA
jgi:hypothetical protein